MTVWEGRTVWFKAKEETGGWVEIQETSVDKFCLVVRRTDSTSLLICCSREQAKTFAAQMLNFVSRPPK